MNDCDDNGRFAISDDTGDLHFTAFDIVNAPECDRLVEELRTKLLDRPLAQIDLSEIQKISCLGNGQCMQTIIHTIVECQDMFLQNHRNCSYFMAAKAKCCL
ncbi:MAG: hypothetical protein K9N55_06445 [Phycisphaerae bacterium]|nr:hypothetical protein [Phycisphaerae bacterium]